MNKVELKKKIRICRDMIEFLDKGMLAIKNQKQYVKFQEMIGLTREMQKSLTTELEAK